MNMIWRVVKYVLCTLIAGLSGSVWSLEAQTSGVSPTDCVNVKYITGLWMSTGGRRVAYLVKAPNLEANSNEYRLYSRDIEDESNSAGRLLIAGVDISNVQWLANDNRIAVSLSTGGLHKILILNVETGEQEVLVESQSDIGSFTMDASGNTIFYSIPDPLAKNDNGIGSSAHERAAKGYRVDFEKKDTADYRTQSIYIRRRREAGSWASPTAITIENPFTHERSNHIAYIHYMSLSPDGRHLFLPFNADGMPADWKRNKFVDIVATAMGRVETMVLYDVNSGNTKLAFKMIVDYSKPVWTSDSRSFFLNAHSPIGTRWEAEDKHDHLASAKDANMFKVDVDSGEVSEVLRHVTPINYHDGPLFLLPGGDVIARVAGTAVIRLHQVGDLWREVARFGLSQKAEDRFYLMVSNGTEIVGVHEDVTTPENLFVYKQGQRKIHLVTDLNAQLRELRFAPVRTVHWTTVDGLNVTGLLFVPPDYVPGRRYPLVIQTKGDSGWFTCDSGANHDPSFAPQPIATAGIMYLARSFDENWNYQEELDKQPKGYPGSISEAVQQMHTWEGAVDMLAGRGLVDPSRVGIIGFSRTGWYVEFDLAHSRTRYAAATATDNVQYSLSDYWLTPSAADGMESMYGGPPYGKTLENWQKYSISFNLDKVHTPVLMELMGYGVHDDLLYAMPNNLAAHYEVVKGLSRLGKPVELYYYPDEEHQLDHPQARQATLQRNVDWYRFWLQAYERPSPEDPNQYKRWEHLRQLREADAKAAAQSQVGSPKPK
jgi:dipeptidyl aminopeptidase/acylaminoacyl peptidase